MKRRTFITGSLAVGATVAALPALAGAGFQSYKPGLIKKALARGETVLVDYSATWCGTCRRQARVIDELVKENPKYKSAMRFIKVDWDTYSGHAVTKSRNIPRRSTLLVLRGNKELGRIVAGTGKAQIKALLNKGLA